MSNQQQQVDVYQASDNSFFVDLLDHREFIDQYEHSLRGEVLKKSTKKDENGDDILTQEWVQIYPPKMNDYGIVSVISFLRTITEKITAITDFDEEDIRNMSYHDIQDWLCRLVTNYYNFSFKSISDLDEVHNVGRTLIRAQYRRSIDGQTLRALTSKTQITESRTLQPSEQESVPVRGGLFGGRFGLKI